MKIIKRMLIIIGCVLSGFLCVSLYIWHDFSKAYEELGDMSGFLVNYLYDLETNFNNHEEQFNRIDSVAREMIRSNPKGVLDDSAKQVLEPLFGELLYLKSRIYFYPRLIKVSMVEESYQPDSTKTCSWGYVWISAQLDDSEDYRAEYNKVYRDYQVMYRLSKNRGWHIYSEGCN